MEFINGMEFENELTTQHSLSMKTASLPSTNVLLERYRFHQRCQQSDETLESFINDVLELAKTCDFGEYWESFVRDRVVFGLNNEDLKWSIMQNGGNPTLNDVMNAYDLHELNMKIDMDPKLYDTLVQC